MSVISPFRALRPAPSAAASVASVPYDVVSTEEARQLAADNPLSFLHVTRPEIDLPAGTDPHADAVYAQAVTSFEDLKRAAPMVLDDEPSLYIYRLRMGDHEQTGLAGCFSVDEYDRDLVKKHEKTRKEKEDDRTTHMLELRAQTGIVFLTYPSSDDVDAVVARVTAGESLYDLTPADGVRHTVWRATGADIDAVVTAFAAMPAVYIADGHHRAASASRARAEVAAGTGKASEADRFIAVAFPDSQVQILAYNRIVRDLAGQSPENFLAALRKVMRVTAGTPTPSRQGLVSMFLAGAWYSVELPAAAPEASRADSLDVEVLYQTILAPLLKIGEIRTDKRVDFVGGIRGAEELERLVDGGQAAVAFSMYPVAVSDLMEIADAGGIMPPKSTWFEPKLRDGLLVHLI